MQKNNFSKLFPLAMICLASFSFFACGGKKKSDVVTPPADQKTTAVNCELWLGNQTFMSASYGLAQSKGDKIFINRLSIEQLMNSLKLESDPAMEKTRTELIDLLEHAPKNDDPLYTIEFTQPAITLRDRLSLGIQLYMEKCRQ